MDSVLLHESLEQQMISSGGSSDRGSETFLRSGDLMQNRASLLDCICVQPEDLSLMSTNKVRLLM